MPEQYDDHPDDDEQSFSTDEEESTSEDAYEENLNHLNDDIPSNEYGGYSTATKQTVSSEIKQHILAVAIAILAAVTTHAQIHGGFDAWKTELTKDWNAIRSSFSSRGESPTTVSSSMGGIPRASPSSGDRAPYAAPSMHAIPTELRQRALQKALGTNSGHKTTTADDGRTAIGHARATAFRRTAGLTFCTPTVMDVDGVSQSQINYGLIDLEFILPLDPSVRVLHSYYLGDALGLDSSFVYENVDIFGNFQSDLILKEIDAVYDQERNADEGLTVEQVRSVLQYHLGDGLVNDEHACLLQQYTAHKLSGRSIRGRTKVYKRPHVSTFYRNRHASAIESALSISTESHEKISPASLTFTGFATKFINLSIQSINLYWDGGRISSGPKAGKMHNVLVGTIPGMESIGTASFPGHSFFVTPTYDKEHVLQRWTVTEDDVVLYYDPLENISTEDQRTEIQKLCDTGKWSPKHKFSREAWMVDRSFGRDYLVKTGRHWLSVFPQPFLDHLDGDLAGRKTSKAITGDSSFNYQGMHMWNTGFIGQVHTFETSHLYFTAVPSTLSMLTKDDYHPDAEEQRRLTMRRYQSSQTNGNSITSNRTISLALKVISCAPRVLEVKKFLSPVEVQHLIDLASGAKGAVSMQRSTVLASGLTDSKEKKTRDTAKQDTRSSTGGWIHREQDVIVDGIFRRVADLLKIDERMMRDQRPPHLIGADDTESLPTHDRIVEAMQLLRYGPGEEYTPHHDFTYPSIVNRYQPKRYATVLMYLTGEGDVVDDGIRLSRSKKNINNAESSDGLEGGETTFPRAITTEFHDGVKVKPQSGKAVLFYNVLPDGNMDDLSQHSGGKVESGVKYVANIWVWDPIIA
ncbi:hypothetical protein ACHAWX_006515 [Stephanocyclus meneghinianus]